MAVHLPLNPECKMDSAETTQDLEQGSNQTLSIGRCQYLKTNVPVSRYHDNVIRPLLQHRPWLENLDQFMEPTTPGFGVDLGYRMNHFDIKVVQISKSGAVESVNHCDSPEKFHQAIRGDQERSGTLIIGKEISRAMIEALGTQYNLEPEFFATHLAGTEHFRMGCWICPILQPPPHTPQPLPDYLRKAPFYAGEFRRPYHIQGGKDGMDQIRKHATCTPRGINILSDEQSAAFVIEKVSVYRKPGSKIGIILTDQLLSTIPPASYMPNPLTWLGSSPSSVMHPTRNVQTSSRRALISWLQSLEPSERRTLFTTYNEPLALQPILKLTESGMTMFLQHTRATTSRILMRNTDTASFPDSVSFFLHTFRSLQGHVHAQQKLLIQALRLVPLRGGEVLPGMIEQVADLKALHEDLEVALKVLEEHLRFLVAAAQVHEGRIVGWVSKFAALFLPVSLLATILAIDDPGYTRWVILAGLSVPFVASSIYFMFFWRPKGVSINDF